MKEIIANKVIVSFKDDNSLDNVILHYRVKNNGVINPKQFYTIGVKGSVNIENVQDIIDKSIEVAENAEGIS